MEPIDESRQAFIQASKTHIDEYLNRHDYKRAFTHLLMALDELVDVERDILIRYLREQQGLMN